MKATGKGPKLLRLNNQKRVLTLLRTLRVTSRQDIAQALLLSKNTVSLIIDEMLENGLIDELGPVSVSAAGRPKIEISLRPEKLTSAGIMVGHQAIHWCVCDYFSRIVVEGNWRARMTQPSAALNELGRCCGEMAQKHPELIGIALGFSGIVDPLRGWMHLSSWPGWQDVDLLTPLRRHLAVPLCVMNNVQAAALLSVQQLQLPAEKSHFYLRVAEEIGGALVQRGEVFNGNSWTAGAAGHLTVQPEGPRCRCGRRGCLEAMIGQTAIEQQLAQRQAGLSWQQRDSAPEIVAEVMTQAGAFLGKAISQIMLLLNPASIIVDCPWNDHPAFCAAARETAEAGMLRFILEHTAIHFLPARIDAANGLALAVIEQYEQRIA
ncbi:ROK family protein [Pantoea sp.]|uniref:ROK family transcriptional regulator n=1 Tax=Pantoea sp. TaxID=69393 RepID=UPI00289EEE3C|nr:ROK family protein [Pantoea sp.]